MEAESTQTTESPSDTGIEKETVMAVVSAWGKAQWDLNLTGFAGLLGLDISGPSGERYAGELFQAFGDGLRALARLDSDNLTKLANYKRPDKKTSDGREADGRADTERPSR